MGRLIRERRGSTAIVVIGIMIGFFVVTLYMMDMFSVYISKRSAQTAADAATLAVSRLFRHRARDAVHAVLVTKLDQFWAEVEAEVERRLADWEADRREELRTELIAAYPELPAEEMEALVDEAIADERPEVEAEVDAEVVRSMIRTPGLADDILAQRTIHWPLLIEEFMTPDEVGCAILLAAEEHQEELAQEADAYAAAHGAGVVRVETPYDGGSNAYVLVRQRVGLFAMDRLMPEERRYFNVEAASSVTVVPGVEPDFSGDCP